MKSRTVIRAYLSEKGIKLNIDYRGFPIWHAVGDILWGLALSSPAVGVDICI